MAFLPLFIAPQTNRLQHVFRDLEEHGIRDALGEQWVPYKQYTLQRYYREWLLHFQRQPGKVLRCAGDVAGAQCPHKYCVDMSAIAPEETKRQLKVLEMDHTIPKHAVCVQWKRAIEFAKHTHEQFNFKCGVNIDFVNHLLFSVEASPVWGAPLVLPRCFIGRGERNCHKPEWEHCRLIGLQDFSQLSLNPPPGQRQHVDPSLTPAQHQDGMDDGVQVIEIIDLT